MINQRDFARDNLGKDGRASDLQLRIAQHPPADEFRELA